MFSWLKKKIQQARIVVRHPECKILGSVTLRSELAGSNAIGAHSHFDGKLGYASYLGSQCCISAYIGKYSCIGSRVNVITADHPLEPWASVHPAFFSKRGTVAACYVNSQKYHEYKYLDEKSRVGVRIGNDVWIGNDVTILGGVTIGDGAVLATGAIVTHDVEPFSIVGGVPAKQIRMRFTDDQRAALMRNPWWEKSEDWIRRNADSFSDIQKLVALLEKDED